jgi:hypothetical protein
MSSLIQGTRLISPSDHSSVCPVWKGGEIQRLYPFLQLGLFTGPIHQAIGLDFDLPLDLSLVLLYKLASPKSHLFSMSCLMINLSLSIEAFVLGKDHGA